MSKVYVVLCCYGEYADYHEDVQATFTTRAAAEKYIGKQKKVEGMVYEIQETTLDEE